MPADECMVLLLLDSLLSTNIGTSYVDPIQPKYNSDSFENVTAEHLKDTFSLKLLVNGL